MKLKNYLKSYKVIKWFIDVLLDGFYSYYAYGLSRLTHDGAYIDTIKDATEI